jgi:hypothetical protein
MSNVHPLRGLPDPSVIPLLSPRILAPLVPHLRVLLESCGDNLELFGGCIADMAGLTGDEFGPLPPSSAA